MNAAQRKRRALFLDAVSGACSGQVRTLTASADEPPDPPLPKWTVAYLRDFDSFLRGEGHGSVFPGLRAALAASPERQVSGS